jgi:hypothetical protein
MQGKSTSLHHKPPWTPLILLSNVLHWVSCPCKNIVEAPGIPEPSPILQTGIQAATCQLGPDALLQATQCSSSHVGCSPSKWILHGAPMKGIHQTIKRTPMPKGRTLSQQPSEVKHPLSKLSQLCKSIKDYLSCANPSWTIQGLNIHHVPQIS